MAEAQNGSTSVIDSKNISDRFGLMTREFMRFSWLRVGLIAIFLVLFNFGATAISNAVLVKAEVPLSYRHMDELGLRPLAHRLLHLKNVGPETLLVMGDCITFGHGVKLPYPSFMTIPQRNILNISMQSMNPNLMLSVLGAAHARGVRDVIIQLHPFEDYSREQESWILLSQQYPVSMNSNYPNDVDPKNILTQSQENWYRQMLGKYFRSVPEALLSFLNWRRLSILLRYHILPSVPLYRDRHLIDYAGPKLSYFSNRTDRIDSYRGHVKPDRQLQILKSQEALWKKFDVSEDNTYHERVIEVSAPARMAAYMREVGMKGTFFLAPTFVEKMTDHTILEDEDFEIMRRALRDAVLQHGARFIDFLDDPELAANMQHFDNLTVEGHKLLGKRLSALYSAD